MPTMPASVRVDQEPTCNDVVTKDEVSCSKDPALGGTETPGLAAPFADRNRSCHGLTRHIKPRGRSVALSTPVHVLG